MPIEIRELVIKVTVHDDARPLPEPAAAGLGADALRRLRKELTESCVQQVLTELSKRRQR
ncbi:DUF5908 family protein [Hymenobacter chitinivorans]|uniref:Uncharacterized protein n=1 Tax=Hymenobacter chitinivorans DSM 11115 TaxID=1121954 RepID=A0A2M9BS61_9BACT|nr:DUF5908 family protein [Hymenobacter chitinivorans]PJJ60778.1 hypothetical protein CLV45_2211 [Hymenobacter chitinivorans DSM 11115]